MFILTRIPNFIIAGIVTFISLIAGATDLPKNFPAIHTQTFGNADPGLVFLSVSVDLDTVGYYIMAVDNDGNVVKHKELKDDYSYDFKMQPNGLLSYAQFLSHHSYTGGGNVIHRVVDDNLNPVDSFQLKNGYIAEAHDFQLLPNGHALAIGYYLTQMDLSDIVEDGYPNAMVSGGIIQELDQDKNVVWQWRSWDHYDYKTYPFGTRRVNLQTISQFHLNTIEIDPHDNNILMASPSWSKKINRRTGDVMWVLGGSYNEFSFIGCDSIDGTDMTTGHTFHRIENGNFLVFDNSNRTRTKNAQIHEFHLDEQNKIATHIRTITPGKFYSSWHRGSAQKLPNGNYFVGWGGALSGDTIPAATEYDTAGNKIFELWFNNSAVESYRAVRHKFPIEAEFNALAAELAEGNTETLWIDDIAKSGISVKLNSFSGDGYNEFYAAYHKYAPKFPRFPGRAPMVLKKRIIVTVDNIANINGELIFQVDSFGIKNPENITIYHREFEGSGLFIPLSTSYNSVKRELKASFTRTGEFIFTYPDIEHASFSPKLVKNAHGELTKQEEAVEIEWAPKGFYNSFNLEVSSGEDFTDLVISETGLKSTVYQMSELENNTTYFWRVQTINDAGPSEWSNTGTFTTSPSEIVLTAPNGSEIWQRGLDYFIEWKSNDNGEVILDLYRNDTLLFNIDTVDNTEAFKWEIPTYLDSTYGYAVHIKLLDNNGVNDFSDSTFAINDSSENVTALTPNLKVLFPNGGEVLKAGKQYKIVWKNLYFENINVDLFADNIFALNIFTENDGDNSVWNVPFDLNTELEYKIKVSKDGFEDFSNGTFTIADSLTSNNDIAKNSYNIHPNPASNIVHINTNNNNAKNLFIYNSVGALMLSKTLNESTQIYIEDFASGIYFIKIQIISTNETLVYKLIK